MTDKCLRGFASMDKARQRAIASQGGKAAHAKGTAHEWTAVEAAIAGRRGGLASYAKRAARYHDGLTAHEGCTCARCDDARTQSQR